MTILDSWSANENLTMYSDEFRFARYLTSERCSEAGSAGKCGQSQTIGETARWVYDQCRF